MKSIVRKLFVGLAAALALAAVVIGFAFWRAWTKDAAPEVIEVTLAPGEFHIGDVIRVTVITEFPWYRQLDGDVTLEPPAGLDVLSGRLRHLQRLGFGSWRWASVLELQAYDFGPFAELQANLSVSPGKGQQSTRLTVKIPEIKIIPRLKDHGADLSVAAELPEEFLRRNQPSRNKLWWLIGALALAAVALAVYFIRRPRRYNVAPPKPWIVAENQLQDLKERLPLDATTVFVELTDIMRAYIEAVYEMPATERTTPEFLQELHRDTRHLSTDHRLLLTDFLTAADMVKFARVDASQGQIEEALQKAKRFVVETSEEIIRKEQAAAATGS